VPGDEPNVRESYLRSDSARLYVREAGEGSPVVVVHGGPDFDHEYLLPELDALARSLRLVYYDQRGRGRSFSPDDREAVTIKSEVADLDAVCAGSGAESVVVLGHSWGTVLALEYALRHADRVSRLILMNSAPASSIDAALLRESLAQLRTPEQLRRLEEIAGNADYRAGTLTADADYYRIHFAPTIRGSDLLDNVVGRLRRSFTPAGVVRAREIEDDLYEETWRNPDYDLLPHLARLRVPTLLLHGEHDFIPVAIAQHIADAMPLARLVVIEDAGHFAFIEQPELVKDLVVEFATSN
jgi:proline iminopeptidase